MDFFRFMLLTSFVSLLHPFAAAAADREASSVLVHIRAVRALERMERIEQAAVKDEGRQRGEVLRIDARIRDLADKLEKLQYRSFRLISSQREVVQVGRRQSVALVDGNQLTLRPVTLDDKRVSMWIKWEDSSGMQVLDTRMHFDCGESVITGVEEAADTGLILAIDVSPLRRDVSAVQPVVGPRADH